VTYAEQRGHTNQYNDLRLRPLLLFLVCLGCSLPWPAAAVPEPSKSPVKHGRRRHEGSARWRPRTPVRALLHRVFQHERRGADKMYVKRAVDLVRLQELLPRGKVRLLS
jgi:hypothetical protein